MSVREVPLGCVMDYLNGSPSVAKDIPNIISDLRFLGERIPPRGKMSEKVYLAVLVRKLSILYNNNKTMSLNQMSTYKVGGIRKIKGNAAMSLMEN